MVSGFHDPAICIHCTSRNAHRTGPPSASITQEMSHPSAVRTTSSRRSCAPVNPRSV
jgi:hypothetical protein